MKIKFLISVLVIALLASCNTNTRIAKYDGIKVKYTVDENGQYTALKVSSYKQKEIDPR